MGLKLEPGFWARRRDGRFGAFVEVEDGIDGLVHISDMSWTKRVRHPKEIVKKGDSVNVVILDINMPYRSGLEVLQHLNAVGIQTPRLILSASDKDETVIEAFELGADDFVRKPFNPGILMKRLQRLLARG